MLDIENGNKNYGIPVLRLGFRPFFLGAAVFSVIATSIWMFIYAFGEPVELFGFSPTVWHAHEMVFGYTLAVIAGFLLTAIKNWTGQQTLRGMGLLLLFLLWAAPRTILLINLRMPVEVLVVCDLAFMVLLIIAATVPILKAKQYKQLGIIGILLLFLSSNVMFYLDVLGHLEQGMYKGVYSGIYVILILVFVMARRVIPFFIERGVDLPVTLVNRTWLDVSSLALFILLWIVDVFTEYTDVAALLAAVLAVLHALRLYGWHTPGLWRKPLLWVLYLAYGFFIVGFIIKATMYFFEIPLSLALHAWTYGGIGMITLGMMARVILGHTGRNVSDPPATLFWCFNLLFIGALFRVVFPLFNLELYIYWIGVSQILWILAFLIFLVIFTPMLVRARIDGRDG